MDRRKALKFTGSMATAAVVGPSLLSLLQSCKNETRIDWTPQFLTLDEAVFVAKVVDMILPRTETPGALDVKVDMFIDKVYAQLYNEEGQNHVRNEIAKFNTDCQSDFGADFVNLSESDQIKALQKAEETSGQFGSGVWGTTVGNPEPVGFYRSLKSTALWGYFTSEEIGENVLNYDPVPGAYRGCLSLDEVGNKWSL
ncbi:gluconate 2-dehydrogenase subunit 3 family protein [Flagellimonas zhangzhouensis]|uniref:Gluconate 2-dehydrogenase subunit 3 n=1 Tax=Flagellimonas zhangzhouensis TaxID=1073328 RepID=A0A1H2YBE3_9FLAO|nr:gluconate 2-dehydrogenase subunit 3 family protein [Allomuricauda zhangzhouensis]SDQ97604.1 Gluconate 2-dehydrogenase subunit 3 [Allomuricauda zhangzhouensis]SDX02350.1 Gluconate 2-dehydrogenase subunit 3 [Allomuricauda zhangzhouensis]